MNWSLYWTTVLHIVLVYGLTILICIDEQGFAHDSNIEYFSERKLDVVAR